MKLISNFIKTHCGKAMELFCNRGYYIRHYLFIRGGITIQAIEIIFLCFIKICPSSTFFHFSIKKDDHTVKPYRQHCTRSSEHTRLQFEIALFNHYFNLYWSLFHSEVNGRHIMLRGGLQKFLYVNLQHKSNYCIRFSQKLILMYIKENVPQPSFHTCECLRHRAIMGIFGTFKITCLLANTSRLSVFQMGVK